MAAKIKLSLETVNKTPDNSTLDSLFELAEITCVKALLKSFILLDILLVFSILGIIGKSSLG